MEKVLLWAISAARKRTLVRLGLFSWHQQLLQPSIWQLSYMGPTLKCSFRMLEYFTAVSFLSRNIAMFRRDRQRMLWTETRPSLVNIHACCCLLSSHQPCRRQAGMPQLYCKVKKAPDFSSFCSSLKKSLWNNHKGKKTKRGGVWSFISAAAQPLTGATGWVSPHPATCLSYGQATASVTWLQYEQPHCILSP